MSADALLSARDLRRVYAGRTVVDLAELDVAAGEVLAILGPNGAGKSTLFRLLLLLERPDAGTIRLAGRELAPGDPAAARALAGVFQRPHLFAGTVAQNVEFGLRSRGEPGPERARRTLEAMDWLGLRDLAGAPVWSLSGGEAQRVALARAVVLEPDVLVLDEPTANLDVLVRRRFREELEGTLRAHARAAVLITHDPGDAFALADRIAVMREGRIVQVGTPEDLVLRPADPFVAAFTGAELLLDGSARGQEGGLLAVSLAGGATVLAAVAGGESIAEGARVHVAYRPEDVTLAPAGQMAETSARNRFRLRVASVMAAGGLVRVRLEGDAVFAAIVTRPGADALGLAPGVEVEAQLKAAAMRAFRAP